MKKIAPSHTKASPPAIGSILQKIRLEKALTLEELSKAAGVSKSMLSQIEREKANPTIAVAWRLARALNLDITDLFSHKKVSDITILETHDTPTLTGEEAQYTLRILGPMELAGKFEWYELTLLSQGVLASFPHDPGTMEHITVLQGNITLEVNHVKKTLSTGATARYHADVSHSLSNPHKSTAKLLMVVMHRPGPL